MRLSPFVLVLMLFMMTAGAPAAAKASMIQLLFNCTSTRLCVIQKDGGGIPFLYELAAQEVIRRRISIRIEGACASACVIFASRARAYACVTKGARMMLHHGTKTDVYTPSGKMVDLDSYESIKIYLDPPPGYRVERTFFTPDYGDDINAWALRENKMPYDGLYTMTRNEMLRYWRSCS